MKQTTRRQFLKSSSAALGIAPLIASRPLFGADAPGNRIGIASIGVGGQGTHDLSQLVGFDDVQYLAVCDCNATKRQELRDGLNAKYGRNVVKDYADFREVLIRDDIDAVVIATPDHWHIPIALAAVRHGKDVYLEKPLGPALTWSWLLRDAVRARGRVLQYGTQQRSDGNFRYACELVRNGYLGAIERVDVWCHDMKTADYPGFIVGPDYGSAEPAPVPEELDYEMWIGPAKMEPYAIDRCSRPGVWHCYEYGLGLIAGWGAHPLDAMQWGLGRDHTSPVSYEGVGEVPDHGLYRTVAKWDVHCKYADGLPVRFVSGSYAKPMVTAYREWFDHGTTFHGEDGWICVDRAGLHASSPKLLEIQFKDSDVRLRESHSHQRDFIDAIRKREDPVSPIDAAVNSDTICHMSNLAVRLDRTITWDPDKEQIQGDQEASDLLDRPLREPWNLRESLVS